MNISFLGAVETVTGSCHLLQFNNKKILLDCGQFQGSKKEDEMNKIEFDFNPADIDYLLLSHSHIDHCGRIPLLVKNGFKGEIICTKSTYDLCQIMLLDSAYIHEAEAEWINRKAIRAGKQTVEPLYNQEDAMSCMKYFKPCLYGQIIELTEDFFVRFNDAGHILGSAIIEMWIKDNNATKPIKLVFTGDLGMEDKPILNNPSAIDSADYVIMEATYGDRLHEKIAHKMDVLIDIILKTVKRGGNVVIPSFAVGRTQEIIYELNKYYELDFDIAKELKKIPVYIDSPLATKITEVFKHNSQVFDENARRRLMQGDNPLEFRNLNFIQSSMDSKALNEDKTPKIIISASGMCEAGRIRHHLKHNLWRAESSIVFVGYQAENTLGRRIKDGEKTIKLFGEEITVNAHIYDIEGFSGHADKNGLLKWLSMFENKPKGVFIVHGEENAKKAFAEEVKEKFGIECTIPQKGISYELEYDKISVVKRIDEVSIKPKEELIDKSKTFVLLDQINNLKDLFTNSINLTNDYVKGDISVKEYNKIHNNLIELENNIMNLTILSSK